MSKTGFLFCLLILLSFSTHFLFFGYPAEVVFDEVHFGKFIFNIYQGTAFFDIHPPLGKLLLAAPAWLSELNPARLAEPLSNPVRNLFLTGSNGVKPTCSFEHIGQACPTDIFLVLRFLPGLFGFLLPILFYKLLLFLTRAKKIALIGGFLVLFENSLLVQSRFILLDMPLIFFGFLGIYLFLKSRGERVGSRGEHINNLLLFFSGLSLGASFSIKWTAFSFLAIVLAIILWRFLRKEIGFKSFLSQGSILILGFIFVYLLSFFILFSLIPDWSPVSGFLGSDFNSLSYFQKLVSMNKTMYRANLSLPAGHQDGSMFYQWLFMKKPVYYWQGSHVEGGFKNIFLFGNPFIWLLSTISLFLSLVFVFSKKLRERFNYPLGFLLFILFGFLISYLPFISIKRVIFLYHYFPAYLFSIINLSFLLGYIFERKRKIFIGLMASIIMSFIFFSPITYGFSQPKIFFDLIMKWYQ